MHKKLLFLTTCLCMTSFVIGMHPLLPIEKELLLQEIESKGIQTVIRNMPPQLQQLYNGNFNMNQIDTLSLKQNNNALNIKMKLYKTDSSNRLASLVFNKIEEIELISDNKSIPPFGVFKSLGYPHIFYAWLGKHGERRPAVTIKANLTNYEGIKEIIDRYKELNT